MILLFFPQDRIPADQPVDLRPHKAPEGIFRGADDRFTTHIKRRIDALSSDSSESVYSIRMKEDLVMPVSSSAPV